MANKKRQKEKENQLKKKKEKDIRKTFESILKRSPSGCAVPGTVCTH